MVVPFPPAAFVAWWACKRQAVAGFRSTSCPGSFLSHDAGSGVGLGPGAALARRGPSRPAAVRVRRGSCNHVVRRPGMPCRAVPARSFGFVWLGLAVQHSHTPNGNVFGAEQRGSQEITRRLNSLQTRGLCRLPRCSPADMHFECQAWPGRVQHERPPSLTACGSVLRR